MMNKYPLWRYLLLGFLVLTGLFYASPNFFGEDPAIQISSKNTAQPLEVGILSQVEHLLGMQKIRYLSATPQKDTLLIRFSNADDQLRAQDLIKSNLGENYIVALNLAPRTPAWLEKIGAHPMKLGLDLRGGINFLLAVDLEEPLKARQNGDMGNMAQDLRDKSIRYAGINKSDNGAILIQFRDQNNLQQAYQELPNRYTDYQFSELSDNHSDSSLLTLSATLKPEAYHDLANYAVEQNANILRNRVNELGVSEAVVQRQGEDKISVDLPGIQDTTRAKDLIGKTATVRFQLVDVNADPQNAQNNGIVPLGSRLYDYEGMPVVLKNQVILSGNSITYASANLDESGQPAVTVRLGGGGESLFSKATAANVQKPLATVYVETSQHTQMVDGKLTTQKQQTEKIINIATIQTALGNTFQITGLSDMKYAQNLALLLRSGALVAPVSFIQERMIGPSLGAANIEKGMISLIVGSLAVILFMILYYRFFGLIADMALILNIVFILAILSLLGATLTLPGIAGIVLTVGIAVDSNVLIFERIREELRHGMSPQASIHTGYEKAFATILDANITTLLVAMILFALGSGVVKGFAITLTIGILTSMVTAIFFTRAIVNLIYGNRNVKRLSI